MTAKELVDLGFVKGTPAQKGDFLIQDDSDGKGPYIREWYSKKPCPYPIGKPDKV